MSSGVLFAQQIRPSIPSSKPQAVVSSLEQSFVLKANSSVLDVYGYGFDSSFVFIVCLRSQDLVL